MNSDDESEDDEESSERPKKKQKKNKSEASDEENNGEFESQNTIRENRMLKKKLSFIVNSLAQRGLITTDFIDLVEEDNVIELDEVKLCESLTVNNTTDNNNNTNSRTKARNSIYVNNNNSENSRSPSPMDHAGSYDDYSGNGIEPDDNNASGTTEVPFIQFLWT